MIISNATQGSQEWFESRSGIPTASNFDKIITTKGEPSKQAQKYMYQLVGERLLGRSEEGYTNHHMERGIELEEQARSYYEVIKDVEVQQVGSCYKDENKRYSFSPDGLIGETGGLEIKCPSLSVHIEYLLKNKLPTAYFQQVQGSLFISGREYWDFLSYYPGIKPLLITQEPDLQFHRKLSILLDEFCQELDELEKKIRENK